MGKVSIDVQTFGVCDFSCLALAALALVVFGAYDSYPLQCTAVGRIDCNGFHFVTSSGQIKSYIFTSSLTSNSISRVDDI